MSRQHRGISTKDLPVMAMPAPFDADLASRLLAKAGVKVTPNELAARASPTAPRRSDLPKLDTNLLHLQHQQFPLPASIPTSGGLFGSRESRDEVEDLRVPPPSSPFGTSDRQQPSPHLPRPGSLNPKDLMASLAAVGNGGPAAAGGPMGSALLDTYLSMIAAAGGDTNSMAAALNFQNNPATRAAAFAAAAAAAGGGNGIGSASTNGEKDSDADELGGELGSDADNDDMSDEDNSSSPQKRSSVPTSAASGSANNNNEAAGGRNNNDDPVTTAASAATATAN